MNDHMALKLLLRSVSALLLLGHLVACAGLGEPSDDKIRKTQDKAAEIGTSLFVPPDASLITKTITYATNPRAYPGCVVGYYYASYETRQSFTDVLSEYENALVGQSWELSTAYRRTADYEVLVSGPQVILEISSSPLISHLVPGATPSTGSNTTVYYIGLRYSDPSVHACSE